MGKSTGKVLAVNVYVDDVLYEKGQVPDEGVVEQIVNPKAWAADGEPVEPEEPAAPAVPDYGSRLVDDLKAEIESRNVNRADDDKIPTSGNKADLVEALEADDQTVTG